MYLMKIIKCKWKSYFIDSSKYSIAKTIFLSNVLNTFSSDNEGIDEYLLYFGYL